MNAVTTVVNASNPVLLVPVNMFMGLREPNVTFCLDISGSMYGTIRTVKEQLIHYLLEQSVLARLNLNRMFNLIAFSTDVYPWSNGMVLWNEATVNNAIDWIKDLETKTGTNTLDALLTAFQDQNTHAVVLVTDDISDQDPYTVINQVSLASRGRPVHCVYLDRGSPDEDRSAIEFLQNLATVTRGSFKIVSIGRNGIEKITPIVTPDLSSIYQIANLTMNASSAPATVTTRPETGFMTASMTTAVTGKEPSLVLNATAAESFMQYQNASRIINSSYNPPTLINTFAHPKWLNEPNVYSYPSFVMHPRVLVTNEGKLPSKSIAWSRFRPVKVLYDGNVVGLTYQESGLPVAKDIAYTPDAGSLLVNRIVLARSNKDGYFYKGKVISQVSEKKQKICKKYSWF
jgi:hypothetical protein